MTLHHSRHPNVDMGERDIPLSSVIYIDKNDFAEVPPKGFKRLIPDGEVRLRHAYVIKCNEVIKDESGEVVELKCSIDPDTLGKNPEGRKVKGVIHWVDSAQGVPAEVRVYERLFANANPEAGDDFMQNLNPESVKVLQAVIEPSLAQASAGDRFQFEREGYFVADEKDFTTDKPVFNRILDLRDSYKPS
jgi:glutaminyl-tRNA synthetase